MTHPRTRPAPGSMASRTVPSDGATAGWTASATPSPARPGSRSSHRRSRCWTHPQRRPQETAWRSGGPAGTTQRRSWSTSASTPHRRDRELHLPARRWSVRPHRDRPGQHHVILTVTLVVNGESSQHPTGPVDHRFLVTAPHDERTRTCPRCSTAPGTCAYSSRTPPSTSKSPSPGPMPPTAAIPGSPVEGQEPCPARDGSSTAQWNDNAGSGWQESDLRRSAATYTIAEGLVVTIGVDDNLDAVRDSDYNDVVIVCRSFDRRHTPLHPVTNPHDFTVTRRFGAGSFEPTVKKSSPRPEPVHDPDGDRPPGRPKPPRPSKPPR